MFRPAKNRVGLIFRKAVACVAAYGFVATSLWAASLTGPQAASLSSARYVPNAMANAPIAMLQADGGGIVSSISSNFNATAIPAGDKIWFTAVMKLNGTVPRSPVSIAVHHSTIQFIAGGINYSLNVPDSVVTFSPGTTTTSATFDTANNAQPVWLGSQLNPQPSGNTLLQAFAYPAPAGGLPGGIKNVTWTSTFSSDTANITLNWQWAAAVYTGCVSSAYNSDNVKPTDDNGASIYKNADHAGTPEACKSFVTQGATGGGASNYTGSLSGTASVTPPLAVAAPAITSTLSPPPNGNGWNNTNVTVSFSCSDANFAIAVCPSPVTVSSEGAGQVITGTAVDQAGGRAAASTSVTINLDKSSPSITATATSSSGNSSVLTLPVTVTFTCTDAVSGVASCPAPIQVTSPGANESFSGTVTDRAGNTASTSIALNTQSAPLAITRSISPDPINGWNKTDVTISYQCTGGVPPLQCPQPAIVSAEGAGQIISATATDAMGQSSTISTTLNIDKTVPVISAAAAPPPNAAGWNTEDVTITYTCSDSLSGIGACPQPQVVSVEGKAQQISASVSDVAGNTAGATTTINLEKTAPLINGTITPAPNAAGWNNSDVTVSFTCTPSVSDIVSCPSPVLATEGTGQEISGTVTDQAGKSNNTTITVNVDKTPPLISAVLSPQPNAAGWNNTPVTVTFTCSDAGSGIAACSDPVVVSAEGVNQVVIGTAMDKAGNIVQLPVTLKIDTTPPVITASPEPLPNAAGWNTTPVTITYACSDSLSGVLACPAPQVASSEGKAQQFTASVTDQAGNTTNSVVLLNIETTAPAITALFTPSPNAAGWNNTDVTVGFNCTPSASDIVSCQPPVVVSAEGKAQSITGTVSDQAGKSATATAIVNLDKTPPLISASAAPPANAAGWNNTDVTISYLCSDSLSGIALCPSRTTVSSEGAAESFSAQAIDQAGNVSTASVTLNIDKTPPIVTAMTAPPANGAGWNNTDVTVTYSCSDGLSGVASCPSTAMISSEGQNQSVPGQGFDLAGNAGGVAAVTVSIDKTAPSVIQITAPEHISRLHPGQVDVTVNDNFTVSRVDITAIYTNSTDIIQLGTFTAPPYHVDLQVPAGANPGDTITVFVRATDEASNINTPDASRGVRVAADGVIVGQVLSDVTSFPIQGASVQAVTKAGLSDQTDERGRYSLQVSDSHLFMTAMSASPATTTVEREVFVQEGVGTVPVDARLTPLASPVAIGSAGGTLNAGNISVTVPAAAVMDGTSFQLTPLSGQGLPGLLPLGWSPVAAFDLRATSSAVNLPASFSKLPNVVGNLVRYNPALHAWTMEASNLQVINGGLNVVLPDPASYALVVPDPVDPPIVIPAHYDPLTGIGVQQLSPQASSSGALSPATLPPSGGTSTATLGVQSVTYVPSGTVIQANVSEKFSLKSGSLVSDEARSEDIILYGALAPTGSSLGAQFPVAPSHKFANTELLTGEVHLDILAGREGVRGQPGGSDPLTLSDGTSTLFVPGGALSEDTAISIQSIALEDFIPVSSTLNALQEMLVDFSGETLNTPAQLSIPAIALDPTHTFLLARVERIDGVPRMVAAALARINGANLTTVASPGLPGLVQGGEYVFYDITAPVGFAQGVVSTSAGPVQAVVQSDSLPIADITEADGRYIVPALAGTVNLSATVPHTNLIGSVAAPAVAGQTVVANITLTGTVTNAVLSPADGSLGVPVSAVITVTTTAPLNAQSIQQANLVLLKSGAPVALQSFVLSNSGTVLSFAPQKNLDPATQYTVHVSGLADIFGGAVIVPQSTFTTKAVAPPNFNPNAITFSFPDANGNIHVSAPAGSLPPGTRVMIIDQTNGLVLSLTALNDGSISGDFPGTINDLLQIIVTDPNGATATFTRSQFVAPDGTVAVGAGGGTVTGPGGVELRIPEGALDQAATFKIEAFGPEVFPDRPDLPGGNFAAGLKVTSPEKPNFNKEVKLVFPKPADAPDGAFFYVYRRMTNKDGSIIFQTIDHAMTEGAGDSAKVVTASPPFSGYSDSYGNIAAIGSTIGGGVGGFALNSLADQNFMMQWTFSQPLIGVASQDIVVGKVLRTIPPGPGQTNPTFEPIAGALITRTDDTGQHNFALSGKDGLFSMFTSRLGAATIPITITLQTGEKQQLDAIVENTAQPDDSKYSLQPDTYRLYKNVARVTVTFGPATPTPPAPQMDIRIFSLDANNKRTEISGLVPTGTRLAIGVASTKDPNLDVRSLSVNGQSLPIGPDSGVPKLIVSTSVDFVPTQAGNYTVSALALSPFGGPGVTASKDFRVLAAGETNSTIDQNSAPTVVSVVPVNHAQRVSPSVFPQVVFSEPVIRVPGNITLKDDQGNPVDFTLLAVGRTDALGNTPTFDDLKDAFAAVTAVTLQPKNSLKYATTYTLTVTQAITDLDTSPKPLANVFTSQFTTMGPQLLATPTDVFSSPRVVILNDKAYIARILGDNGSLEAYSTENPAFLGSAIGTAVVPGSPTDLAGEVDTSPNGLGRAYVVVSTGLSPLPKPSNVWIYDVSDPTQLTRLGVVGMSGDAAQQGLVLRLAVKDGVAYASTFLKGIQTFNVAEVVQAFQADQDAGTTDWFAIATVVNGSSGYNNNLVHTIPVTHPVSDGHGGTIQAPVSLTGLGVADYTLPNQRLARLVVASGLFGITVVDPVQESVLLPIQPIPGTDFAPGRLDSGFALALTTISEVPIAAVVGRGNGYNPGTNTYIDGPVLAILDMTNPALPQPISFMALPGTGMDILISRTTAFVSITGSIGSGTILIDLSDLAHPYISGGLIPGLAGRLALQNGSILYSTGFGPINGGIHSATVFGSACDVFRNKKNPPAASPGTWSRDKHLEWSLNYSWRSDSHQTWQANDGLVLSNVQLGRRKMANEMSLPYFTLQRTDPATGATSSARCELIASQALPYVGDGTAPRNTPSACDTLPQSRSMLVDFRDVPSDGTKAALEATYLIDHLDGDPQKTPEVPDSCVVVKQRYEFYKEGLVPFEPFGFFPSARFRPLVDYQYFTDSNGPTLNTLTAAQRLDFDARTADAPASKAAVNDAMLTCDVDSVFDTIPFPTSDCRPSIGSLVGMYRNENPLAVEQLLPIIVGGARNHIPNTGGILPGSTTIDNFHQNPTPAGDPDHAIDEPSASEFGCPACVHIHWRWSKNLFPGSTLLFLGPIDPGFDNHKGNLIIAPGSNQDVTIGILQSGGLGEKHPRAVEGLFFPPMPRPITPSSLIGQSIPNIDNSQVHPVFWYIATGHKNADEFFFHGGGFGTFYLNRITIPAEVNLQTTPMSFNIEHSRSLHYTITVVRDVIFDTGTVGGTNPVETTISGTLPVGQDDIVGPPELAWTLLTSHAKITVTLTDTSLIKSTWQRTYDFTAPTPPDKPFEP